MTRLEVLRRHQHTCFAEKHKSSASYLQCKLDLHILIGQKMTGLLRVSSDVINQNTVTEFVRSKPFQTMHRCDLPSGKSGAPV
jgi:hypothetical protein